jgi:transcriptional regulator with XRE-family HTH domain
MTPAGRRRDGLASARRAAGYTQEALAAELYIDRSTVIRWEAGDHRPLPYIQPKLARLLGRSQEQLSELIDGRVELTVKSSTAVDGGVAATPPSLRNDVAASNAVDDQCTASSSDDDEAAAFELGRRVAASDVGNETLTQLELVFDDLAMAYSVTPPQQLLQRLRQQLSYVSGIMDANKTLDEHRRLVVIGAWLSLLAATVHVDLEQQVAATTRLRTAASLARHADHDEIRAWCFETEAWRLLTNGQYRQAVDLSRAAQALAPPGSSVAIQATAQEGRAWARIGQPLETYAANL